MRRRGFTLIELLVLIAIIAVLIGRCSCPPCRRQGRQARGGAQCINNMKQIGIALHNYINANDCFPPAALARYTPAGAVLTGTLNRDSDFSAHARLLGFMEQQALFNAMNFNWGVFNDNTGTPINSTVAITRINASSVRRGRASAGSLHPARRPPLPSLRRGTVTSPPEGSTPWSSHRSRPGVRPMGRFPFLASGDTQSDCVTSSTGRATLSAWANGSSAPARCPPRTSWRSRISSILAAIPAGRPGTTGR